MSTQPDIRELIQGLLLSVGIQAVMTVESANKMGAVYMSVSGYETTRGTYSKPSTETVCADAKAHADRLLAESTAIHERNLPAVANNLRAFDVVTAFMEAVGIPARYQKKEVTGRTRIKTKIVTVPAGWTADLTRIVITSDWFNLAQVAHGDQMKRIEEYRTKELAREAEERRLEEAREIARKEAEGLLPETEVMARHSEDICYGEHPDFELIGDRQFVEEWRWGNLWSVTVRSKKTGKIYTTAYRTASGDSGGDFNDCNGQATFTEVVSEKVEAL